MFAGEFSELDPVLISVAVPHRSVTTNLLLDRIEQHDNS
jgi:hypothetical protein